MCVRPAVGLTGSLESWGVKHINDTAGTNNSKSNLFKGKLNLKKRQLSEYFNLKTSICSPLTAAISSSVPSETSKCSPFHFQQQRCSWQPIYSSTNSYARVSSCICLGQSLRLQEDIHMFASLLWSNTQLRHSANCKCVLQVFKWSCIKKKPKIKTKEQLVISYVCRHLCPTVKQSWTMIFMLTAVSQQQVAA